MISRAILLFLFLLKTILSNEIARRDFAVVSTTNRAPPTDNAELENRLRSLESQIILIEKMIIDHKSEFSTWKENQKMQFALIEKKLDTCNVHLPNSNISNENVPRNCKEIRKKAHNKSGVYSIHPKTAPEPFLVLCDFEKRGGGWTYILNRFKGSQNFDQSWQSYKHGFGALNDEFWLGLENIHHLTGSEINELLIELVDWDSKKVHALYSSFSVGNEQQGFHVKLLGEYSGDAGNSIANVLGMKFSTKDHDQDLCTCNCAAFTTSGWWYKDCVVDAGQLTGKYLGSSVGSNDHYKGMFWASFHGGKYSLKEARMMVRPVS